MWGNGDFGWCHSPVTGQSGGVLSIWDSNLGSLIFTFTGCGFSGVGLSRGAKSYVVNLYSPCNLAGKRKLWCIVADFNAVTSSGERRGSNERTSNVEIEEFNNFIAIMELVDPLLLGRKYTWYKAETKIGGRNHFGLTING